MPFLPNANMLVQFILSLFLFAFCFQIYIIITAALSGSYRGMRYSAHCLSEPEEHLSARLNASLSETIQTQPTNKALLPTVVPSALHKRKKKTRQYSNALCSAFSTFSHPNLWMLGLTRLALSSSRSNTSMSVSEFRPGRCRATGHKRQ